MSSCHHAAAKTIDSAHKAFHTLDEGFNNREIWSTTGIQPQALHIEARKPIEMVNSINIGVHTHSVRPQLQLVWDDTGVAAFFLTRGIFLGTKTHATIFKKFLEALLTNPLSHLMFLVCLLDIE